MNQAILTEASLGSLTRRGAWLFFVGFFSFFGDSAGAFPRHPPSSPKPPVRTYALERAGLKLIRPTREALIAASAAFDMRSVRMSEIFDVLPVHIMAVSPNYRRQIYGLVGAVPLKDAQNKLFSVAGLWVVHFQYKGTWVALAFKGFVPSEIDGIVQAMAPDQRTAASFRAWPLLCASALAQGMEAVPASSGSDGPGARPAGQAAEEQISLGAQLVNSFVGCGKGLYHAAEAVAAPVNDALAATYGMIFDSDRYWKDAHERGEALIAAVKSAGERLEKAASDPMQAASDLRAAVASRVKMPTSETLCQYGVPTGVGVGAKMLGGIRAAETLGTASRLPTFASDADRVAGAEGALGRSLTPAEGKGLIEAHNIGASEGRGYGTYTLDDINRKARRLAEAGFTAEERRILMEKGIAGQASATATAPMSAAVAEAKYAAAAKRDPALAAQAQSHAATVANIEKEVGRFHAFLSDLNDRSALFIVRLNGARLAAARAANVEEFDVARALGRQGAQLARSAFEEAKSKQPGLTMEKWLAGYSPNGLDSIIETAGVGGDRQLMALASGARERQLMVDPHAFYPPYPRGTTVQTVAFDEAVRLEGDLAGMVDSASFRRMSAARQNNAVTRIRRQQLAALEGSGVDPSADVYRRTIDALRRLDPTWLDQKPQ